MGVTSIQPAVVAGAVPRGTLGRGAFAQPGMLVRSWYVVGRSDRLKPARVQSVAFGGHRFAVWRDADGQAHAHAARCPHLGADLGQGDVIDGTLRCPFHHWRYESSGQCVASPGHDEPPDRRVAGYPVVERFGLIWLFVGHRPQFELPAFPGAEADESNYRRFVLRPRHVPCHPHLVVGNGLDARHLEALHGMRFTAEPIWRQLDPYTLTLAVRGRPRSRLLDALIGSTRGDVQARFTAIGSSIGWVTVTAPLRMHCLFTGRPGQTDGCDTQTVLWLPRGLGLAELRAAVLMAALLRDDVRVLERIKFHPGFTHADEPLRTYAEMVNAMETA